MACTLPCCGAFCCFVSVICGIMQFVFYILLSTNSERIDVGESKEERSEYADTALWTAIIYFGLVIVSLICLSTGYNKPQFGIGDEVHSIDEEESVHLINGRDNRNTYASTSPNRSSPNSSDLRL